MSRILHSARRRMALVPVTAGVFFAFTLAAGSQVLPRVTAPVSNAKLVTLKGNTLPVATSLNDLGRVPDSTPTGRVMLVLRHSAEQQTSLDALVAAQQTKGSTSFHHWLKTADYGRQFGVADADIQTVTSYLSSQGFTVAQVFPNKMAVEFSGTAGQIRTTFKTEIHHFKAAGQTFSANDRDPQIPAALAPVIRGFASLNNYQPPTSHAAATRLTAGTKHTRGHALYTDGVNDALNVAPGDIAKIYDIPAGADGTGVTIGAVNIANVNLAYLTNYQVTFGLPQTLPNIIVDGNDPGEAGNTIDGLEQLELLSAVAPNATLNYYTSTSNDPTSGVNFAIIRAIDDDQVQVLLYDQENCEANLGTAGTAFFDLVAEQASAEGITVISASGNGGSDSCQSPLAYQATGFIAQATTGLSVNGYASTPFVTAVGATDFDYGPGANMGTAGAYWNLTNGDTSFTSALKYIPEQPWNISDGATNIYGSDDVVGGTGGGISTLGDSNADTTTAGPYPAPSWQIPVLAQSSDPAIAASTARVVPDVAIFGGNGLNGSAYMFCAQADECVNASPGNITYELAGGTNVSSATFAGIAALVVQAHGLQGNINPTLYSLYQSGSAGAIFHASVGGTNTVACAAGSPDCGSGGYLVTTSGELAYSATTSGYNAAVGLGSVDVKNLIADWATPEVQTTATTFTLTSPGTATPMINFVHGATAQANVTVTSGAGTPAGDVAILDNSPLANNRAPTSYTLGSDGTVVDTTFINTLPGGVYQIQARYAGAGIFEPSYSTPFTVTISPETSELYINSQSFSNGATITYGTNVTVQVNPFSATNPNSIGQPTGVIQVLDNGKKLNVVSIDSTGIATFSAQLASGAHSLTFSYSGDASYQASSTSTALTLTVSPQPTSTVLSTTSSNDPKNGFVQLVAVVNASGGAFAGVPPTGTISFETVGTKTVLLGKITLVPGLGSSNSYTAIANLQLAGSKLSKTADTIQAFYNPATASSYAASSSNMLPMTFTASGGTTASTTTIATADNASSYFDYTGSVNFNLNVGPGTGTGVTPTGTVAIYANGALLGTETLSGGTASLAIEQNPDSGLITPPLSHGSNIITAQYSGDANYATSTSALTITVLGGSILPDFSLQSNVSYETIVSSSSSDVFILHFTSINNFAALGQSLALSATTPAGITCSFSTNPVTFSKTSNYQTDKITCQSASGYTVAHLAPTEQPLHRFWLGGGAALACVLLFGIPARRKGWQGMLGIIALAFLSIGVMGTMTACGSRGTTFAPASASSDTAKSSAKPVAADSGTLAAGTYQVLVTATAPFANGVQANTTSVQTHTLPLQIVVQ